MAPLRVAAEVARGIGPDCRHTRLPVEDLPSEVRPLVEATNSALDRLQDAWGVQQRFVAHAAHEMRTPVAVFRAAVERLPPTGERAALLDDVDRLARLIGQLLDLARVQQGDVDNDRIDAAGIARDVAIGLAPLAANRNVTIAVDLPARLMVSGSTAQLTPVLRNLIENAILHAPPASEVRVGIDGTGRLVVEDRGPGVPAEARDLIFERFQRGAWTTTQGSGLGLSIASEAAQRMRALLSVEDNTPRGARFAIRFAPN
jgi:signal transduction histidine kinase